MFQDKAARYERARRQFERQFAASLPATLPVRGTSAAPLLRRDLTKQLSAAKGSIVSPPLAFITLTRAGYGPRPGDISAFNALGGNDTARLNAWVQQQLDYQSIDDSELNSRLIASRYQTLNRTATQLWQDYVAPNEVPWEDYVRPLWDLQRSTLMRAVYGRRQLYEVMVEFWNNHFSVSAADFPLLR